MSKSTITYVNPLKLLIPPPVYMVIFAGLMWLLSQYYPVYSWSIDTQDIGIGIIFIGGLIDLSSLFLFLIAKTSVNPMKPEKAETVVKRGMYKFSRNPMYLGLLLLLTGWSLFLGVLSALVLLPTFVWTINTMQIQYEEVILEQKFGDDYVQYKKSVRRWI
ncbi:MAG: isoprenylcysteine carboxylmethyltransferase family protein [Gammaproteobacteria bacterium]|nr:isoprenylcysteine carboxylmethyltransferase family protein [Gammaproteobacteria bacterium]